MNKVVFYLLLSFFALTYGAEFTGKKVFEQKCSACHTVGRGRLVGPDLKGVTERRNAEWLRKFIKSPTSLINEKDGMALSLLKEYRMPMPDLGLTDEEVSAVIGYLRSPEENKADALPLNYLSLVAGVGLAFLLSFLALLFGKKSVEVKA